MGTEVDLGAPLIEEAERRYFLLWHVAPSVTIDGTTELAKKPQHDGVRRRHGGHATEEDRETGIETAQSTPRRLRISRHPPGRCSPDRRCHRALPSPSAKPPQFNRKLSTMARCRNALPLPPAAPSLRLDSRAFDVFHGSFPAPLTP